MFSCVRACCLWFVEWSGRSSCVCLHCVQCCVVCGVLWSGRSSCVCLHANQCWQWLLLCILVGMPLVCMGGNPLLRTRTAPNSLCAAVHPWPPCRHMHHHWAAVVLLKQYLYVSLGFHACGCVPVPWPHCWVVCVLKKPSPEGVMPGLCETVDTFSLTWVGHPLCGDDGVP